MVAATMAIVAQPASAQTVEHGGPCPAGAEGSQVPGEWGYWRPTGTSCIFPDATPDVEHGGPCPAGAEGSQVPGEWGYWRPTGTSCIFPGTSTPDTPTNTTTTTTAPTAAPPLTPSDNCDYSQADMFNGYGWDNVALESCPPRDGDGANGNGQAENVDSTNAGTCPAGWPGSTFDCRFNVANRFSFTTDAGNDGQRNSLPVLNRGDVSSEFDRDNGGFRTRCLVSHFSYSDALVAFGEPTRDNAHLHMFFGNTSTGPNSVNGGITGSSTDHLLNPNNRSTCGDLGQNNLSAYWIPALLNEDGEPVVPDQINVYYKTLNNRDTANYRDDNADGIPEILEGMRPIPNDLRLISDDGKLKIDHRENDGTYLVLRVEFQNCIRVNEAGAAIGTSDGVVRQNDPKHRANYTMAKHTDRTSNGQCGVDDDDFVRIPGLEFNIQWKIEQGSDNKLENGNWTFSNGVGWDQLPEGTSATEEWPAELSPEAVVNGHTHRLHADYMAAWENNDSWDTSTGAFVDRTTDAMSQLLDQNQQLGSSLFTNEFDRLTQILNVAGQPMSESGGVYNAELGLAVDTLVLPNGTAIPCLIGGNAAPDCT